ncbi:hypothetical protein M406DRAFT_58316 [Cryphonectria parasitica EP155]|uniref:Uncharacterized protein n=1 Tax=Cryphonectria parasitica (strain ATCC 38755 / EP155) TaxID=660469 RepID=A0A9P4Y7C2_CRYP1|nr:uncharacterized protein M406DRAFT_58316 [Cryphonectria parasitica EP155]KAF3768294.1 hypothetical protein M406DRAFT_58316 [Cryphonectria parasitica EP155]
MPLLVTPDFSSGESDVSVPLSELSMAVSDNSDSAEGEIHVASSGPSPDVETDEDPLGANPSFPASVSELHGGPSMATEKSASSVQPVLIPTAGRYPLPDGRRSGLLASSS